MNSIDNFLEQNKDISDSENVDALLNLSGFVRKLYDSKRYNLISILTAEILNKEYYEAFTWIIFILQENLKHDDININLGRSIQNYDAFIEQMGIELKPFENLIQKKTDTTTGEQSFSNIFIYKTQYDNVYFISAENFDTKDNDFIQYEIIFTIDINKYINRINKSY